MPDDKPDKTPKPKSNWKRCEERKSALLNLPEIQQGGYIIEWLSELDWYSVTGMGTPTPLTWTEIDAWARVTNTTIDSDDVLLIRHLSKIFVGMLNEAKDPACPAPYADTANVDSSALRESLLTWANSFPSDFKHKTATQSLP